MLAVWVLLSVLAWAVIEYTAHRWFMHESVPLFQRRWEAHMLHHGFGWYWCKRAHRHIDDGVSPAWNVVGSSPAWLLLGVYVSLDAAIVFAATGFIHGLLWTMIHHSFHDPRCRWFENTRLYRLLEAHHQRHHDNDRVCFGALFGPLVDWPMRTKSR